MTMVHSHQHAHPHPHSHAHAGYSYSPSDYDLLRALTAPSSSSNKQQAKKTGVPKRPGLGDTRRPQLDPLILETAAHSGPHVTRNHFLHEFYPHPEDPSSSFSHLHFTNGGVRRNDAYASCDLGPEDDIPAAPIQNNSSVSPNGKGKARAPAVDANEADLPIATDYAEQNGEDSDEGRAQRRNKLYQSRQAPRKLRLEREAREKAQLQKAQTQQGKEEEDLHTNLKDINPSTKLQNTISHKARRRSSFGHPDPVETPKLLKASRPPRRRGTQSSVQTKNASQRGASSVSAPAPLLEVACHARTRVPTPHGEVFLHLYKNNLDDKEHLAFVFDREQLEGPAPSVVLGDGEAYGSLRSKSLDATWRQGETDMERIVRGAFVGRLTSSHAIPSDPANLPPTSEGQEADDAVLVRVHSECFTGETIGSQRCDCGEQLDEAFRLIATSASGKGIIVYLRQEGRGIGLLEKIKAYNLQDLGHDTVTANLLLGHNADLRSYGIAGEILRDLGVEQVKLLTNNPDKIDSVEKEGIRVIERVPMVPRGWSVPSFTVRTKSKRRKHKPRSATEGKAASLSGRSEGEGDSYEFPSVPPSNGSGDASDSDSASDDSYDSEAQQDLLISLNRTGVGMIGSGTTHSVELEKYLKTKIERMGHMLAVPNTPPSTPMGMKKRDRGKSLKKRTSKPGRERMEESTQSIRKTDEEEIQCGDVDCKECEEQKVDTGEEEAEHVEDGIETPGLETQPGTPAAV